MSKQPGRQLTRRTFIKAAGATGATVYVIWSGPAWFGTHVALAANLTALEHRGSQRDAGNGPPAVPARQARR